MVDRMELIRHMRSSFIFAMLSGLTFPALFSPASTAQLITAPNMSQTGCGGYTGLEQSYGLSSTWRFLETAGTTAADSFGTDTGTYQAAPTLDQTGPLVMPSNSILLNGSTQYVSTATQLSNPGPSTFSLLIWFKTSVGYGSGGKLIGYGNAQTGSSGNYDRHIYMDNAGHLYLGIYPGSVKTVQSTKTYNDGNWHMAGATLSGSGMYLIVDNADTSTLNASVTTAQAYAGYWRIGYDNLNGWTNKPTSNFFKGNIAEAAVSPTKALTQAEFQKLYLLGSTCRAN